MKRQWSIVVLLALVFGVMAVGVRVEKTSAGQVSPEAPRTVNPAGKTQHDASHLSRVVAGNSEDVEFVGRTGGDTRSVAVSGNYAYIGEGSSLTVMDISDPTLPHVIGRATNLRKYAFVYDVVVKGDLAYAADGSGLSIININNPRAPIEVGYYDAPDEMVSVAIAGEYALIGSSSYLSEFDLRIINVADPTTPYETAAYNIEGGIDGGVVSMTVDGGYLYFVDRHGTLLVINVMDPKVPYLSGAVTCGGPCVDVAVKDGFAYVADGDSRMYVFDISNPAIHPYKVGSFDTVDGAVSIALEGNHAYVGTDRYGVMGRENHLLIIDISNPTAPFEVGSLITEGVSNDIVVAGGFAYLTTEFNSLCVVDIEDPATPIEVGSFKVLGNAKGMTVAGDYAYVVDWPELNIISIADPAVPKSVGYFKPTLPWWDPDLEMVKAKGHIYVPAGEYGLGIIDVTNPLVPIEVGFFDTPGTVSDVIIVGEFAYIADGERGLRIISIANPAAPVEIGFIDTPGWGADVDVAGSYAYMADQTSLRIINIADPFAPSETGFYPRYVTDVTIIGHYAYLNSGDMPIIDVADASEPYEVGSFDVGGTILAVEGSYAYITAYPAGLRIFNLANPAVPVEVGFYDTLGYAVNVTVAENHIYATDASGFSILRFNGKELSSSISGRVTTQNGTPLPGVFVNTTAGHATTDANGHYTITGVPAGTYNVGPTLTSYSFTPLTRSVTVPPDSEGVDFIAYPQGTYSISGKVTLQDGTPLPGIQVGAGFGHYDFTDRDGIYTIDGLDAGVYELSATGTGYTISPEFPEWQPITLPPTRNDVNFIASTVTGPALNPISNADGNGYFDVTWKSVEGASRYQLQANQNGSANRLVYEGTRTIYAASDAPFGKWCFRVHAQVNGYWSLWSAYECTDVRPPLGYIDLTISIYREVLDKDRDAYENILRHFADAIYEMTNGAQRVRVIRIYQNGENANTADVRWVEKAWPSARLSGVTIPGHQVKFADTLDFGGSEVNALVWGQQHAGYTLAHEWGHYYYGLKDEYRDSTPDCSIYCPGPNDEPVPNSIMNQQKNALGFLGVGDDFNWLNFSVAKNFNPNNAQYRTYWASGWDTLKRPSEDDPQHLRRAGHPKRVYYPELGPVAPIGDADASLQLPGGRQEARSLLAINWIVSSAGRSSHDAEPSYWAQLSALEGPEFDYPTPIVLVASVKQHDLVAQAGRKATALAPDGAEIELSLLDDGNAPDALQNDGVYTGFLPYDQNGAYQVTVDFDNVAGAAYFTETAYEHSLGPNGETFDPATAPPPPPVSTTFSATATTTVVVSGYQDDDHGNTPAASSLLSVDNKPRAGRIDYAGDVDVFKLVLPNTGATIFRVSGLALGIHPQVRILDGNGVTVLGEYEIAPEAGEYFFRPLEGNKGDTFYVRIADKHGQAAGGLYSLSAGDPLPNEIEEPSLDTSIYLPITIR